MAKRIVKRGKHHANYWKGEILFMIALMKHPKIPRLAKILVFTLLSYIFSPIDLIPDFIPIFGHWDDILAIPITMRLVSRITPTEIIQEVRNEILARGDVALFTGWGPKLAAMTVLLLWILISWFFLHLLGFDSHFSL